MIKIERIHELAYEKVMSNNIFEKLYNVDIVTGEFEYSIYLSFVLLSVFILSYFIIYIFIYSRRTRKDKKKYSFNHISIFSFILAMILNFSVIYTFEYFSVHDEYEDKVRVEFANQKYISIKEETDLMEKLSLILLFTDEFKEIPYKSRHSREGAYKINHLDLNLEKEYFDTLDSLKSRLKSNNNKDKYLILFFIDLYKYGNKFVEVSPSRVEHYKDLLDRIK